MVAPLDYHSFEWWPSPDAGAAGDVEPPPRTSDALEQLEHAAHEGFDDDGEAPLEARRGRHLPSSASNTSAAALTSCIAAVAAAAPPAASGW